MFSRTTRQHRMYNKAIPVKKRRLTQRTSIFDLHGGNLWISPSMTNNYANNDPCLDWFEMHGDAAGFQRDHDNDMFDFSKYVMDKGMQFEATVFAHLKTLFPDHVVQVGNGHDDSESVEKFQETLALMRGGTPIILQAVLHCRKKMIFGSMDMLVRSDWINRLTDQPSLTPAETGVGCVFSDDWHYRVIDCKFSTITLNAGKTGILGCPAYKTQIALYNAILEHIQGYAPDKAFILGRGWKQNIKLAQSSNNALERLCPIDFQTRDVKYMYIAEDAVQWLRRLRRYGNRWRPISRRNGGLPTVPELYPNMSNTADRPWHNAKKQVAQQIGEITQLYNCGTKFRQEKHALGKFRISDLTPEDFNNSSANQQVISSIVERNNQMTDFIVTQYPEISSVVKPGSWIVETPDDFYIDFETVNDANDDFSSFPEKGGSSMVWMIGCGFRDRKTNKWQFQNFVANTLSLDEESRIFREWFRFMGARTTMPRIFHWSNAEQVHYYRAKDTHVFPRHPKFRWVDMNKVFLTEGITIKDAYDYKLKNVARAFKKHGFIDIEWENDYIDGLGSSVAAWRHAENLQNNPVIQEVEKYNEIDCKVIYEIVDFLRRNFGSD